MQGLTDSSPPPFIVLSRLHSHVGVAGDDGVVSSVLRLDVRLHVRHFDHAPIGRWGALGPTMVHGDAAIPYLGGHTCNMSARSLVLCRGRAFWHSFKSPAKQLSFGGEHAHLIVGSNDDDGLVGISLRMEGAPEAEAPRVLELFIAPCQNIFAHVFVVVGHEVGAQEV